MSRSTGRDGQERDGVRSVTHLFGFVLLSGLELALHLSIGKVLYQRDGLFEYGGRLPYRRDEQRVTADPASGNGHTGRSNTFVLYIGTETFVWSALSEFLPYFFVLSRLLNTLNNETGFTSTRVECYQLT